MTSAHLTTRRRPATAATLTPEGEPEPMTTTPTQTTPVPSYFRQAVRTQTGAAISPSPDLTAPAWLIADARTPTEVADAFAALDVENAKGREKWNAVKAAGKVLADFDDDVRRATYRGEDGPDPALRERLVRNVEKAEGALRVQVDAAFRAARNAEDALWTFGPALQALAAAVAVEAHSEAVEAHRTMTEALSRREAAYARVGYPGGGMAGGSGQIASPLYWQRVAGMGSRISLAEQDVKRKVVGWPVDLMTEIAEGSAK
jgi:hypothetical protein